MASSATMATSAIRIWGSRWRRGKSLNVCTLAVWFFADLVFARGLSVLIFAQHTFTLLAMAAQSPLSNYWSKLTDPSRNPFRGLYQLNSFDLAVMIPYFLV